MYEGDKWSNILVVINGETSCSVNTARHLKNVWPFFNIMHERVEAIMSLEGKAIAHEFSIIFLHKRSIYVMDIVGW